MRRAVSAEEEPRITRCSRRTQRQAVLFAFGHRQAIVVRFNAAHEDVVAVDDQVVRGDCCAQIGRMVLHIRNTVFGCDMLHNLRADPVSPCGLDQARLSMNTASRSNISTSLWVTSPCTQSGRPISAIFSSEARTFLKSGHAAGGVCGRAGRVEFDRFDQTGCMGRCNIFWIAVLGQVQRHQRLKCSCLLAERP